MLEESIKERIERLRLVLLEKTGGRAAPPSRSRPLLLEQLDDAREETSDLGKCLLIEKEVAKHLSHESLKAAQDILMEGSGSTHSPLPAPGLLFLDLETTGLSATPLFLAGMILEQEGRLRGVQLLARDYSEERALINLLDRLLREARVCITFNGKAFDIPYLKERAKYHRLPLEAEPEQFDLLHHARRLWKHSLPDCRLLTLEWYILGRRRIGDVGGWEVPCIYHEFVHTRDATRLKSVLRHNFMDVLAMAELFIRLAEARAC